MSVAFCGTGRRILLELVLFRRERGDEDFEEARLWSEGWRTCLMWEVRRVASREAGGASPKMKNLMKAPIRRTTESWPMRSPCVKDSSATIAISQAPPSRVSKQIGVISHHGGAGKVNLYLILSNLLKCGGVQQRHHRTWPQVSRAFMPLCPLSSQAFESTFAPATYLHCLPR